MCRHLKRKKEELRFTLNELDKLLTIQLLGKYVLLVISVTNNVEQKLLYLTRASFKFNSVFRFSLFYHFDFDPRFPPFLLYVRWRSGVTFVPRCFRDDRGNSD